MTRVLGIDPGLRITGYGCVEGESHAPRLVEAGVFRLVRGDATPSISSRLAELDRDFRDLLARVRPDAVAVEGLFAHVKHPATSIVMGHARGVLLLAVQQAGLPLIELKPAQVKKSLVGSGRAEKGQMQRAIQEVFRLPELPRPPDVADALAIALAGHQRHDAPSVSDRQVISPARRS
ncbi:MAG: crossover junction endodeoxyribonuclease RuvC [Phycisphaerae bacterium]|nr:MAG: crossover junction endodeoxyribonuclease RuvC [Phycisphaerae bacterium]